MGPYWTDLRRQAAAAVTAAINGEDDDLQEGADDTLEVLQERFEQYLAEREDDADDNNNEAETIDNTSDFAIAMASRLMDRTGRPPFASRLSGRLALLYLIRAQWDLEQAVENAEEDGDAGEEVSEQEADERGESLTQRQTWAQTAPRPRQPARPRTRPLTADQTRLRGLNPNIDRDPSVPGPPVPAKFTINLAQPTGQPKSYTYGSATNFDWTSAAAVRGLNKWRSQVFLRQLGPKQEARLTFTQSELDWLTAYIQHMQRNVTAQGGEFDLGVVDFPELVRLFNNHFDGQLVPGSKQLRQPRTEAALRAELGRIPEVVRLTGMAVKKSAPTKGGRQRGPKSEGGWRGGKGSGPGRGGQGGAGTTAAV